MGSQTKLSDNKRSNKPEERPKMGLFSFLGLAVRFSNQYKTIVFYSY